MTGVEAIPATMEQCHNRMQFNKCEDPNHLIEPTKPIGKILKGPSYTPPQLGPILAAGNWLTEPANEHTDEQTETGKGTRRERERQKVKLKVVTGIVKKKRKKRE